MAWLRRDLDSVQLTDKERDDSTEEYMKVLRYFDPQSYPICDALEPEQQASQAPAE